MNDQASLSLLMFAGFSTIEAQAASPFFKTQIIADGKVLFAEGDPGNTLCVVEAGKVVVVKGEREVACMTQGRAFGEMSVLDGRPRSATCRAVGACRVLTLNDMSLRKMMKERPEIAAKVLYALASSITSRLRRSDQRTPRALWGS